MNEHLKSFLITFFVGFAVIFVTEIDTITIDSFYDGVFVGLVFASVRGGVKGILELLLAKYSKE